MSDCFLPFLPCLACCLLFFRSLSIVQRRVEKKKHVNSVSFDLHNTHKFTAKLYLFDCCVLLVNRIFPFRVPGPKIEFLPFTPFPRIPCISLFACSSNGSFVHTQGKPRTSTNTSHLSFPSHIWSSIHFIVHGFCHKHLSQQRNRI